VLVVEGGDCVVAVHAGQYGHVVHSVVFMEHFSGIHSPFRAPLSLIGSQPIICLGYHILTR